MTSKSAFLSFPLSVAACLISVLAISPAHAAVDASANTATSQSSTVASRTEAADVDSSRDLESALISLQQLQEDSRQNASELAALKETVKAQSRLIEELKRNNGTTTQSSTADVSDLKSKMDEQNRTISKLQSQLSDLQRNSGPNSTSSSSEISSLQQEITNLRSSVGRLESLVSSLNSKVK
ncbi:hypothetical protein [Pseudomonas folii]|uniref:Uncharacterized protein n=1 Tax=Pseudomonas folii TaxID=2762593 RepID=A0ABR7AUU1_9PSED|nr:hypothetical protein [Pseudomonas folii]MBC3948683.1 hypothetical protein [Pseudomonas folii]